MVSNDTQNVPNCTIKKKIRGSKTRNPMALPGCITTPPFSRKKQIGPTLLFKHKFTLLMITNLTIVDNPNSLKNLPTNKQSQLNENLHH